MLKFIRRLFILLVLFTVIFIIYRYINPDSASLLVDKIKTIPDTISSIFWWDKEDNIKIESEIIQISGDIDSLDNSGQNTAEDLDWLKSLNAEIELILWEDKSGVVVNETMLENTGIVEEIINTGIVIDNIWVIVDTWIAVTPEINIVEVNNINTWTTVIPKPKNNIKWGDCGQGLTQKECDEIKNTFGNIIK